MVLIVSFPLGGVPVIHRLCWWMIVSVPWGEMARGMPPQHLPQPLWTWN